MGIAHKCLRELGPAYNDFQHAYALENTNPDVGREFACICMSLGRGEEAVRISREVMNRAPTDAGLTANYALALLIAGYAEEAEVAVSHSLELDPQDRITQHLASLVASVRTGRTTRPDRWPR
jgi:predicted Zn-dependent protease